MTSIVQIVEVGPRDGLQNESRVWSVSERVHLINLLGDCGFREIEVGSFVSPKWVPQMDHTDQVYEAILKKPAALYSVLVPNEQGMRLALASGCQAVSIFAAASESFSKKNINCTIAESYDRFKPVLETAQRHNIRVRGYVSCAIECPYEGPIDPSQVASVAKKLFEMGCAEISLGDTIGRGTPTTIRTLIKAVSEHIPISALAIHCHDTYGNALENILAALDERVRIVDAAVHGLGGCPYGGEQAKGNVSTELVVAHLPKYGYETPVSLETLQKASAYVGKIMADR